MNFDDLKFKINYNFGSDSISVLGSISDFKEKGSVHCHITRQQISTDPALIFENAINGIIDKLKGLINEEKKLEHHQLEDVSNA